MFNSRLDIILKNWKFLKKTTKNAKLIVGDKNPQKRWKVINILFSAW